MMSEVKDQPLNGFLGALKRRKKTKDIKAKLSVIFDYI